MINYDNIPEELRQLKQWVCVSADSKVPKQALSFYPASSVNPATWSTFEDAVLSVKMGFHDYIGFVFADNGIVGIDIDEGYTQEGFVSSLASDIITKCWSYTERSKSKRGFHIFVKGEIPFKGKNNLAGVEVYKTARFFIMTGEVIEGPTDIRANQEALDDIVGKYFPETRESKKTSVTPRIYNPEWECPKGSKRVRIKPNYPIIQDGCRNICLTSLAGMMHSIGYTKGQIYRELQYANNTACRPPVLDSELRAICNSVTKYRR
jgi:hypothetical protein